MTKKQFVALANSIREHNRLAKFNGENAFTVDQLAALARFCALENPRFKRERWLDYIAGRCGPNWRHGFYKEIAFRAVRDRSDLRSAW